MFLLLAFFTLFGPIMAATMTLATAAVLLRTRPLLSGTLFLLIALLLTMLMFEFRYDLGLELPDITWMPSGAAAEAATLGVACLLLIIHILSWVRWPAGLRGKWTTISAAVLWALAASSFLVLSQLSYSI